MYLPSNSTIAETCEWLQCETGQQWSLPRLLEEGHLTPYVWIDYVEGLPLIFGNRLEGFLTKMAYHGDVIRLAADRNDALLTMFTGHDGALIRPKPGWRVELKHIRFQKPDIERVAEIINKQKTAPATDTAKPAPVVTDWRNAVRAEAWEKWVKTLAENGTPTLENVSVYLASWCDANQIMTDTGKTPKSSYLKIHVIDGKHWNPPRNMSREAAKKHLEQKEHAKQAN